VELVFAQVSPDNADDKLLHSDLRSVKLKKLIVCNRTGSTPTFRVFLLKGGEPDAKNAIFYDVQLAANETKIYDLDLKFSGDVYVRESTGNQINFTLVGEYL